MGFGDSVGSFYIENGLDPSDPYAIEKILCSTDYFHDMIIEELAEQTVDRFMKNAKTVFVDNLDSTCTTDELKVLTIVHVTLFILIILNWFVQNFFSDCGKIESIRFPSNEAATRARRYDYYLDNRFFPFLGHSGAVSK